MSRFIKYHIALLLVGFSSFAYAIEKVEIKLISENALQDATTYAAPFKKETLGYLAVGENLSEAKVIIFANDDESYRVAFQLETSMTITAEGPHLDLTDWKHCTTQWHSTKALTAHLFQLPHFDKIDTDCFPQVSPEEIKAEVFKQGGEDWVSVLEKEGLPEKYSPIEIALSTVRIKIERRVGAQWEEVTVINLEIPMGC